MRSRCGLRHETRGPGHYHEDSPLRNPGRLMFAPPLLSPDAVRPRMCAWPPSIAAAARGDAGQAAYASVRSRHGLQSKRAAFVGETTSAQVET